jgi:tRNA(ile)-lysidine synthase
LRPLLNISKKEILEFLEKNNLPYKIDKTNFENDFARNKLRNLIIPKFSEINEKYKQNISNFMDYLDEIKDLLDLEVKNFLEKFD